LFPNKPHQLATGGDDCRVKFWDTRKFKEPIKALSEHSHWIWNVKYNRFHDQLIVTCSSDSQIDLWNVLSISSVYSEHSTGTKRGDHLVRTFTEHEESIYSISWSCKDTWVFASLSYDGRVVINYVPQSEIDAILLKE